MLKKFIVENFKGFKEPLVFDLTAREYAFNRNLAINGIVNKAIVYGKNGIGKSCLGIAIFDIVRHLTDKEKMPVQYLVNYINLESGLPHARFQYYFQFDDDEIIYEYEKKDPDNLVYEKLWFNQDQVLNFHYYDREQEVDKSLCGDLNIELVDNKLSVLKYIYRNTPTNYHPLLTQMMQFCEKMLWYRGLSDGNVFCGFSNGGAFLTEMLYESGKIHEFEQFLEENEVYYRLKFINDNGVHQLMALFDGGKRMAPFMSLASTGTLSLLLFFVWRISSFDKISFLFIDEFDAFFHFESARMIVRQLNKVKSFQSVLTSHNTYLMQNRLTRPDCCFIMTHNKITSLFNSTDKEIREAHNLEKMYVNGVFDE